MAFFRKIKAGLVKSDIENFVGEEGNIFFNVESGELRLSDGVTPGGIGIGGGGGGNFILPTASTTTKGGVKIDGTTITINNQVISGFSGNYTDLTNKPTIPNSVAVSKIDSSNVISGTVTNISAIRFDADSGFDVTDLGSGAVKISMNSTFKTWKVNGQQDLVASGLDIVEFVAGNGVTITTLPGASPYKQISFSASASMVGNLDAGGVETNFGGLEVIDAGGI